MSELRAKFEKNPAAEKEFLNQLKEQFTTINQLLYTTSVPADIIEQKVMPYMAEDVVFKDPWQEGGPKENYRIGMKGFHKMFHFDFTLYQIGVTLNDDGSTGRCIIDGIMHDAKTATFSILDPLRTILVYNFRLLEGKSEKEPQFEIFHHEEMWSYADMIEGVRGIGWVYKNLFRPAFGHLFITVSFIVCWLSDWLVGKSQNTKHLVYAGIFLLCILPVALSFILYRAVRY